MSLFVGNVSKHVSHRQLQALFKKFGKCRIDLRDRYAFVQFDNDKHAEQSKKQLQHQAFHGLQLNIQWSKNSGRFGQNKGRQNQNNNQNNQRKRSRSRQNRWRRDDRWARRSPSYQKRSSPSYSGNKDIQTFVPQCQRDQIILRKLIQKKQQTNSRKNHLKDNNLNGNHKNSQIIGQNQINNNSNQNNQNIQNNSQQIKQQNNLNHNNQIQQDSRILQQGQQRIPEDGQIPTIRGQQ